MFFRISAVVGALLYLAGPAGACAVGDLNQTPTITILTAPPDCCYGGWAGDITGIVNNVNTDSVGVVLYAQTNWYWVQPYAAWPWTNIACPGGTFSNQTHGGHHYCAILAKKTWNPPATLGYLPPIGGNILAIACVPNSPRTISAFGYTWYVKSNTIAIDPGPNIFTDSEENVWVDGAGRLHLKITHRGDAWLCPEVFSEGYFPLGFFTFELEGQIDQLDPNVVLGCFLYSENFASDHDEIDFEASRWGIPGGPNAQYVLQPWNVSGNRHQFAMTLTQPVSFHTICWEHDQVTFSSCQGHLGVGGGLIEQWTYAGPDVPVPDAERMRFNLWLLNGNAPTNSQEVEVIISDFRYGSECTGPCTSVPVAPVPWGRIKAAYR